MPTVSILLPTYNRSRGLLRTLNCFLSQKRFDDFEIIISDNNSFVDPYPLLKDILSDSRISYFRQTNNLGMAGNAEFLFSKVRGKYLLLASDDDWWSEHFLSTLVGLLNDEPNAAFAMSNFCEVDEAGHNLITSDRFIFLKKILGRGVRYYPNHFPLLKTFHNDCLNHRLVSFIDQKEFFGKANIHRSICQSDLYINAYYDLKNKNLLGCWGFDQLLAFRLLVESKLVVSDKLLFKCTVGNRKHYVDNRSKLVYLHGYKVILDGLNVGDKNQIYSAINRKFTDVDSGFSQQYLGLMSALKRVYKAFPTDLNSVFSYHENGDFLLAFDKLKALVNESNDLYRAIKLLSNSKYIKYIND